METDNLSIHDIQDGHFPSRLDGAHCYYKRYYPKKELSKKVIHIIFQHGAIEYHKRHEELFDALRVKFGNKLVISCLDLVGHGFSGGTRAYIDEFDTYIEDFTNFLSLPHDIYEDETYQVETHIIAHSLGGMIVLKTLVDAREKIPFEVKSVSLTNPCIRPNINIPKMVRGQILNLSEKLAKIRLPSLYDGFDLTSDRARAIAFNHDHLNSHFMTLKMGAEILRISGEITPYSYYIDTPIFFIVSGKDVVVDSETTRLFISGIDSKYKKESYYPDGKHDILNEKCRKEVFGEIIEYIGQKQWETQCIDS